MKTRQCEYCKKDFIIKSNWPSQRFCSRTCGFSNRHKSPPPYSIETICKCGCGKIVLNPDDHYRYRKFIPEHRNGGRTHPRFGYKESEEHVKFRVSRILSRFKNKVPTCIEKELYDYLDTKNIEYEKQKQVGRFIPDAYILQYNLCIFADGGYWHNRPEIVKRDKRCNVYLLKLGYNILRLKTLDLGYKLDLSTLIEYLETI